MEQESLGTGCCTVAQDVKSEESASHISKKLDSGLDFLSYVWEGGEGNYTNWPFHSQHVYQE